MGLPYVPGAIRARLLGDAQFATLTGNRCTVRQAPADVTTPFAVIQVPGGVPVDDRGWALKPLVQVNAWCPRTWTSDPDTITWDIVSAAVRVLGSSEYVIYADSRGSMAYKARIIDGRAP